MFKLKTLGSSREGERGGRTPRVTVADILHGLSGTKVRWTRNTVRSSSVVLSTLEDTVLLFLGHNGGW